jgi:hypothetical protein
MTFQRSIHANQKLAKFPKNKENHTPNTVPLVMKKPVLVPNLSSSSSRVDILRKDTGNSTPDGHLTVQTTNQTIPDFESQAKRLLLQEKLDHIYQTTGQPYQGDLWDLSDFLSQWMKGRWDPINREVPSIFMDHDVCDSDSHIS